MYLGKTLLAILVQLNIIIFLEAASDDENTSNFWNNKAQGKVKERLAVAFQRKEAKNIILFMGDGMSIPTLAATRMYMGGENAELSFDKFPHLALSKTYCVDYQVADSACASTAYLGGVKGNLGTIGVTAAVKEKDCEGSIVEENRVPSIGYYSQIKGKSTGFVTTTRVTHDSPAGLYAHTADGDWESDAAMKMHGGDPNKCNDTAKQLVYGDVGKNLNVIMGGGRNMFLPNTEYDEDHWKGQRDDGEDLIKTWMDIKNESGQYVHDRDGLLNLDYTTTDFLLGLFSSDHIPYNLERNSEKVPSLEEMTEAAVKILSKNPKGYLLFVEGGRIDMAHHESWARKALDETVEFSKAIQKAVNVTSEDDTLIVVTADHAHTLSYSGYPFRGNDILGIAEADWLGDDNIPFLTLSYANGPGAPVGTARKDVSSDDTHDINYRFPAAVPFDQETHGGDDVIIAARGPWSHLFSGVMEQNVIPHLLSYASCVGEGETACGGTSAANLNIYPFLLALVLSLLVLSM